MPSSYLTKQQALQLAQVAGIPMDDQRAELAAARLGAALQALDQIPAESLANAEPALTFAPTDPAQDAAPQDAANQDAPND